MTRQVDFYGKKFKNGLQFWSHFSPSVANMSYFWDNFGPVHKIPENSAPVLVGEAGASVHAQISLKMRRSNKQTLDDSESGVWTSKRLRRNKLLWGGQVWQCAPKGYGAVRLRAMALCT